VIQEVGVVLEMSADGSSEFCDPLATQVFLDVEVLYDEKEVILPQLASWMVWWGSVTSGRVARHVWLSFFRKMSE
jgi:hypothetical protein